MNRSPIDGGAYYFARLNTISDRPPVAFQCDDAALVPAFIIWEEIALNARDEGVGRLVDRQVPNDATVPAMAALFSSACRSSGSARKFGSCRHRRQLRVTIRRTVRLR